MTHLKPHTRHIVIACAIALLLLVLPTEVLSGL
jgi:hypothetical protein